MGSQGNTCFGWSNHLSLVKVQYREQEMTLNVTHHYQIKMKEHPHLVLALVVKKLLPDGGLKCWTLLKTPPMPQSKFQLPMSVFCICPKFNLSAGPRVTYGNNQTPKCMLTVSLASESGTVCGPVDFIELVDMGIKMKIACLYRQALIHMQTFPSRKRRMNNACYLYRNKTKKYFKDILRHHAGIMHPYKKDNNGDPENPMNGKVDGLFFMANQPAPPWSGFGPIRILILLEYLLNNISGKCNTYFADFYCMDKPYSAHYISVVFTENGSHADRFCRENLLPLPADNPFFRFSSSAGFKVSRAIWVEIFYTKQIDIATACAEGSAEMKPVPSRKKPRPIEGTPKNPRCSICNIREDEQWEIL